eukprot:351666-Chlamydomonas_euryale.AAC.2
MNVASSEKWLTRQIPIPVQGSKVSSSKFLRQPESRYTGTHQSRLALPPSTGAQMPSCKG